MVRDRTTTTREVVATFDDSDTEDASSEEEASAGDTILGLVLTAGMGYGGYRYVQHRRSATR